MSEAPLRMAERDGLLEEPDEIDVELRTPAEVRTRVLILAAILRRLALENAPDDDAAELLADAFDEREWLRDQGLAGALTKREAALLSSPLGSLAPEAIVEASWQGEGLIALAWAIGIVEMPPIDATSDPRPVIDIAPRPWDAVEGWMMDPSIVSESDAVRERELAEIWHWRATTELLLREGSPADREDYEAAIREVATEALAAGKLPALRDGDLPARGRSIRDLAGDDLDELTAVTGQRLLALNWVCGFGDSWDDVPFDV
jgi:hypothetical protein